MPDYSLGRAHGEIQIDFDGSGADRAERALDKVAASSESADKSLTKTGKTLRDTDKEFDSAGNSADGYSARLRDVQRATEDVEGAERDLKSTLLDGKASVDDIESAYSRLEETRKRHTKAIDAERDAHKALSGEMNAGQRAFSALANLIPDLNTNLTTWASKSADAVKTTGELTDKTSGLATALGVAAKAAMLLGQPEVAGPLAVASEGIDKVSDSATNAGGVVGGFVKQLAGLELAVGKFSGLALGGGALGGLVGLGGAAGLQGIVEMVDAVKQLSGVLGLLPAAVAGAGFSMATLQIAFHGVGDALSDMMADDPKKFLEDIKGMGPVAAQAMLQVAQFRDQFKMAGGAIQDSFFKQIAGDIAPLIQTWLPAVASGMAQIAGIFGEAAHQLAGMLQQPAVMQAFQYFVENIAAGLKSLEPAIAPLLQIFTQLIATGSSFFSQIGQNITGFITQVAQTIQTLASSGKLQSWIQDGINAFGHLVGIAENFGSAFLNIMDIADKFGGGGLLGWLEQVSAQLNSWTSSAEGQKALTDFFTLLRQATDAFLPMLPPLLNGLASIATAFAQLGVGIAPGWQDFFNMFAQAMATLGPSIAAAAPAINAFLHNMGVAMVNIVNQVGPRLPDLFLAMSNAFATLLPQIGPLLNVFIDLAQRVGPQLPKLFSDVTSMIEVLLPYVPMLVDLFRNFVSVLTWFIESGAKVVDWFSNFLKSAADLAGNIPGAFTDVKNAVEHFFGDLATKAVDWGKNMISGLVDGITNGLGSVGGAAKDVVLAIARWFQSSPAEVGPFSGSGYTLVRGQKMVQDMAAGMVSARSAVEGAAASTAAAASSALGAGAGGTAGAAAPGGADAVGGSLLPPWIAGADNGILNAYLNHQFPDNDGLKGLAKDLGNILQVSQSGFNLLSQNILQPLFSGLGMIPGLNNQTWKKMSPEDFAAQQQQKLQRDATQGQQSKGPDWTDVLGPGASPGGSATPLGLTASSSKADIQKGIIAAGRARGMNDAQIQTALAIASDESGFNPTISGGSQGSAGQVSGLFQQSPTSGWGTMDQVNDPNHAINAFYDAYAKNLKDNPTDPMLAAVLTQNPQLGSSAKGSDYWNAVSAKLGEAGQILTQQGPGVKNGPTWGQVTGGGATPAPPTGMKVGKDGSISVPTGTPLPAGGGTYGLPKGTDTGGYGTGNAKTFPEWVMALAAQFGVKPSTYSGHQETNRDEAGYAPNPQHENRGIDWSGSVDNMQRFADFLAKNSANMPGLEQIIWQNPNTGQKIGLGGAGNLDAGYYPQSTYDEHGNHVHTRQSAPIVLPTGPTPLSAQAPGVGTGLGTGLVAPSAQTGLILPSGQSLDALTDNTAKTATTNDQLLQAYLQGNPALASQIDAARTPGASDDQVLNGLNSITSTITDLKTQDAVGNKNTIDALQSTQSSIAQGAGFQQAPSGLQQAQGIASSIGGAVSGAYQVAQSYLDALSATQDFTDRLVYGIRNTEDVNKLIDDYQKWITVAANVASEVGNVLSAVGAFTGGADMGGTSAAGSAASLIASVLQGVNAAIDYGQEIYHIVGTYVGRLLSQLTAGVAGTPLMGDTRFLLNTNTNQLLSYSEDNPGNKNTLNVPGWLQTYDAGSGSNPNPQVNTQWNIYAGPGQSPGEMLNETMWMYNTAGTTGAMSPANF